MCRKRPFEVKSKRNEVKLGASIQPNFIHKASVTNKQQRQEKSSFNRTKPFAGWVLLLIACQVEEEEEEELWSQGRGEQTEAKEQTRAA